MLLAGALLVLLGALGTEVVAVRRQAAADPAAPVVVRKAARAPAARKVVRRVGKEREMKNEE